MWMELLGSWSGLLAFAVILLSALAIPGAIFWALMRQYKGPAERAHEADAPAAARRHSAWHDRRYVH